MDDVTAGEHVYVGYDLPLQARVPDDLQLSVVGGGEEPCLHSVDPISGSSLHLPLMQMSWPAQSSRVLHASLQEEMAVDGRGRETTLKTMRVRGTKNPKLLAIW